MFNDETESTSGTEQPQESNAQTAAQRLAQQQKATEAEQQATNGKQDSNDTPKPIFLVRMWRRLKNWWTDPHRARGNFPEHLTVFISIVIAVIAGFQWNVYRQQKTIMESGGKQTQQLIDAANIQACAATKSANAAARFATSAEKIDSGIGTAVGKLNLQAEKLDANVREAHALAQQAERSAKATEDAVSTARQSLEFQQRPWITLSFEFSPDVAEGPMSAKGTVKNVGNGPALTTIVFVGSSTQFCGGPNGTLPANPPYDPIKTWPAVRILMPTVPDTLQPYDFKIDPFSMGLVKSGVCALYVYADAQFCDVFHKGHYQHYCGKWVPNTPREITACDTYNDGDQDHADQGQLACVHLPPHMAIMIPKIPPELFTPDKEEKK
jgi:hypothetical protein